MLVVLRDFSRRRKIWEKKIRFDQRVLKIGCSTTNYDVCLFYVMYVICCEFSLLCSLLFWYFLLLDFLWYFVDASFFGWRWLIDFCWWLIDLCCWVVGLTPHPVPVTTRMTLHFHLKKSRAAAKSSLSIFTGTGGRSKWVADVLEEKCLPRRATKTSKRNYAKKSSVDPQASAE